jgi:hypothetical protein
LRDVAVKRRTGLGSIATVEHIDNAVTVRAQGFGTLADFAAIVDGEAQEAKARVAAKPEAKKF